MASVRRDPQLLGQTVVVAGGSAGVGLETARRARAEGAAVVIAGRSDERLAQAALELGVEHPLSMATMPARCIRSFVASDARRSMAASNSSRK